MPKRAKEMTPLDVRRIRKPGLHAVGVVSGLYLKFVSAKECSWVLRVKIGGKRRDRGLGSFPEVTLQMARDRAREARDLIRDGIDPRAARIQAQRAAAADAAKRMTFEEAAEQCWATRSKDFKNSKHAAQWINTLREYAYPTIGKLDVADVERAHVYKILEPIWEPLTETATRLRGRIHAVLAWTKAANLRKGENAADWESLKPLLPSPTRIKKRKLKHHPALPWHLMADFLVKIKDEPGVGARCQEFVIQTAARSLEARGATWDEIDLDNRVWTIPAHRMKVESEEEPRIHRVPLNDEAMRILKALPRFEGTNLLFPGPRSNDVLSDNTLLDVVNRVCKRLDEKPRATPHGMRSAFKDWHRSQPGFEDEVSELALAHVNSDKTRAAYARDELLPKRRTLMQKWCKFCLTPRKPTVVQLRATA